MTQEQANFIVVDPYVVGGQAHVRRARVTVGVILDCLAAGLDKEALVAQYPGLSVEGIRAAAAYGGALAREEVHPLAA